MMLRHTPASLLPVLRQVRNMAYAWPGVVVVSWGVHQEIAAALGSSGAALRFAEALANFCHGDVYIEHQPLPPRGPAVATATSTSGAP